MTSSELAAVLDELHDEFMLNDEYRPALRESAAILRRLGDDALEWHVYANTAPGFDPLPEYRRRVLTPAEPVREPVRWICTGCGAEGDGPPPYSHARAEDDGRGNPVPVECGPCIQIEGAKP